MIPNEKKLGIIIKFCDFCKNFLNEEDLDELIESISEYIFDNNMFYSYVSHDLYTKIFYYCFKTEHLDIALKFLKLQKIPFQEFRMHLFIYALRTQYFELFEFIIQKMKLNISRMKEQIADLVYSCCGVYCDYNYRIIEYLFFKLGVNNELKQLDIQSFENGYKRNCFSINDAFEFHIKKKINVFVIGFLYGGYQSKFVYRVNPNLFHDILSFLR